MYTSSSMLAGLTCWIMRWAVVRLSSSSVGMKVILSLLVSLLRAVIFNFFLLVLKSFSAR